MVNTAGGPCVGLKKRPRQHQGDQEPAQLCAAVSSHRWYGGPTCKNCYERNKTERNNQPKMAKTDDAPAESGGDNPLVCLRVSAARCALPPVAPQPARACIPLESPPTCSIWACTDCRSSHGRWWTGATLRRSQTMRRATRASSTTSTAGSSSSPTPMVCDASTVSGYRCTIWSRQKVGRRRF